MSTPSHLLNGSRKCPICQKGKTVCEEAKRLTTKLGISNPFLKASNDEQIQSILSKGFNHQEIKEVNSKLRGVFTKFYDGLDGKTFSSEMEYSDYINTHYYGNCKEIIDFYNTGDEESDTILTKKRRKQGRNQDSAQKRKKLEECNRLNDIASSSASSDSSCDLIYGLIKDDDWSDMYQLIHLNINSDLESLDKFKQVLKQELNLDCDNFKSYFYNEEFKRSFIISNSTALHALKTQISSLNQKVVHMSVKFE